MLPEEVLIYPSLHNLESFNLPIYYKRLIHALTPGSVQFVLTQKSQGSKQDIVVYSPNIPDDFESFVTPQKLKYTSQLVNIGFNLEETPSTEVTSKLKAHISAVEKILPVLLDLRDDKVLRILRPGVISKQEIQFILPKKIRVEKNYLQTEFLPNKSFILTDFKPKFKEPTVILGTKEDLKKEFNLWYSNHFEELTKENFTLINLGSRTNPENILNRLGKNFLKAFTHKTEKIFILNHNWPSNQWGEILRYVFDNTIKTTENTEKQEKYSQSYLQGMANLAFGQS